MKRKFLIALSLTLATGAMYAQGEMDAYRFSRNDLTGTARSVSMGGAFGALGGDISGVAINPAGIGVYKTSEIVGTINFQNTKMETNYDSYKHKENKFAPTFDNLAFVGVFPLYNDVAPVFNFGFSYNRLKSFGRKYSTEGSSPIGSSLTDYMAVRADDYSTGALGGNYAWDNDWLAVLGYNSGLIVPNGNDTYKSSTQHANGNSRLRPYNRLFVEEKGSISAYDFNFGTTFSNILSVGLTLSVTSIDYRMNSQYSEDFMDNNGNKGGYDLNNRLKTEGSGMQVKAGAILKPVKALRIGVAYHSPTWYDMTDFYSADVYHNLEDLKGSNLNIPNDYQAGRIYTLDNYSEDGVTDYKYRTPDKWTFSLAGVLGQYAIISADYELTNYKNMRLHDDRGNAMSNNPNFDPNTYIKSDFKNASALRVGLEGRITPQFSARIGYSWIESPLKKDFKDNLLQVDLAGTIPHYTLEGDTNHFTYGLGYRFKKYFYVDVAFVMTSQKDDLYFFPKVEDMTNPDKVELKTNRFQGLITFGARLQHQSKLVMK